ncbi:hypothetical protein [Halosegnis sp.]|uniref:hypothetical protein n=1 Tax=Halosegnis sp. TaxID=2864959 RepID=UPI0035D500A3
MSDQELPDTADYARWQVAVSAVVGIAVALLSVWWAQGFNVFYESLYRVNPSVEGGGIGADWVAGNSIPALDFLIAFIHAADVIMGVFILVMVFLHWAAFRRLAGQMRGPDEDVSDAVAADGGEVQDGGEPR